MSKNYAVLTGDLVGSSELPTVLRQGVLTWLKDLAVKFDERHKGVVEGELDVFRGDSWQLCLKKPSLALEAAVFIRAGVKAHLSRENPDTRIGIGIGTIESINAVRISESSGPAFSSSGSALDSMVQTGQKMRLSWAYKGPDKVVWTDGALSLLDLSMSRWTHPESVAVFGALMGWTQEETAQNHLAKKADGEFPSRQSIADALRRVGWQSHLIPALNDFRILIKREG